MISLTEECVSRYWTYKYMAAYLLKMSMKVGASSFLIPVAKPEWECL